MKRATSFNLIFLALLFTIFTVVPLHGGIFKGQVIDSVTGNPVSDVNVIAEHKYLETAEGLGGSTDMDGIFTFELPDSSHLYSLTVSHIRYHETKVDLGKIAGQLPGAIMTIRLEPQTLQLSEVVVVTGRGVPGKTPGAISNIDRSLLELTYGVQDVPLLASETPGAVAFSWSGSTVGASQMKIRGFGTERLSVTVNGIPINDPEDHFVYWQDTPDFLSNTHDIQVQRGVSSYLSGPAGMGGGLNLATSDAVSKRELKFTLQAGSFNTLRRTLSHRTGIIDGRYNFTGRVSQVSSDGYRDHTSSKLWSYFLGATRFDRNMITRLQYYGGREEMDAYWWGIDKSTLEKDRCANYSAWYEDYHEEYFWDPSVDYDGERDVFRQPHYVLLHQWKPNPKVELNQSLFFIEGDGYYEEFKPGRSYYEYNLSDNPKDNRETDLIRRKYVEKKQLGWMPRLTWEIIPDGTLGLGLELRGYRSDHYGKVTWASELPNSVAPDHDWYRWEGDKDYVGGYANMDYKLNERIKLNGGLQLRRITYRVDQHIVGAFTEGYNYELDYLFINPSIGATFNINDRNSLYLSLAGSGREPIDEQILDADNPDDIPKVEKYKEIYEAQGLEFKEIDPERMWDVELGSRHSFGNAEFGANIYGMFFEDEIVSVGFSSDTDEEVFDNAPRSTHVGIEVEGALRDAVPGLSVSGNLSFGQAILGDYEIEHVAGVDDDWNPIIETVNLKGNRIGGFPDLTGNLRLTYTYRIATGSLHAQYVGKQYMDNREDDDAALDGYTLLDAILKFQLLKIKDGGMDIGLELRGMNLLDLEYEPYGVVDVEYGTPYYVPAAGFHWLAGITLKM